MLALKAYSIEPQQSNGAASIRLVLYWQALQKIDFDYSTFAHVLNTDNQVIAQQDQAPGQDRGFPPLSWRPGDIIVDTRQIPLPPGTHGELRLRIGAYNYQSGARLALTTAGVPSGDFFIIQDTVVIR